MKPYVGMWRAFVMDNNDPEQLGRLRCSIPEVYGQATEETALPWAWPCIPIMGGGQYDLDEEEVTNQEGADASRRVAGGTIALPPVGSTVWVQFEHGDPQFPVWMGTWMGLRNELPSAAVSDTEMGVNYPKIMVIQMPWAKDMFIRFSGNRSVEVRFGNMGVRLVGESEEGEEDGKVQIFSTDEDIEISSQNGQVSINGKTLVLQGENNVGVYAGKYKRVGDEFVVDTVGRLLLQSTDETKVSGHNKGIYQTVAADSEMQALTPKASGFDRHGESV